MLALEAVVSEKDRIRNYCRVAEAERQQPGSSQAPGECPPQTQQQALNFRAR